MWRSYDMVDGPRDWSVSMTEGEALTERVELDGSWLMPRLVLRSEVERRDQIVRIPPGFISC